MFLNPGFNVLFLPVQRELTSPVLVTHPPRTQSVIESKQSGQVWSNYIYIYIYIYIFKSTNWHGQIIFMRGQGSFLIKGTSI